ncbi:MAG: ATP/GTP hydrolase [Candidatus Gottesmanbacteria bacterium GW2011_GWA1_43_11]|uniref:tRNA threonylcarbamoyladenosine biosynthesis protein TsaE n=1 Tax=Candidatus Gottesmanbacteria bacterium GW2011_GWA1_43_11 TaxID=1618436 RepID=A0A0G1EM93_9BACT|nr:MAG: ATP/GTP hydrolase [Candidatus Gottesmanbacteria bacterium GW2011_GWA1_43_11]
MEITTTSAKATQNFGEKIGHSLIKKREVEAAELGRATILTLSGELGSGKTTFVQGLAKGLGLTTRLVSPTFVMVKEYPLTNTKFKLFLHLDLYQVQSEADLAGIDWTEILTNPSNLVVIEWPEVIKVLLPKTVQEFLFRVNKDDTHTIAYPHIYLNLLNHLSS